MRGASGAGLVAWLLESLVACGLNEPLPPQDALQPLIDDYIISQYNWNIQEAKGFGLIRSTFRFEDWYEPKFLKQALEQLGLENFWKPANKAGVVGS